MKIISIFFCLIFFVFPSIKAENTGKTLTFKEALNNKDLQFRVKGLDDSEFVSSRHYGKSLKISVKNSDRHDYSVSIPVGAILSSADSNTQDMIVTKPIILLVEANKIKSSYLYAMCIDMEGSSPQSDDLFKFAGMADHNLLKVCQFIEKMNYQNETGQDMVWVITDNLDPYDISGDQEFVKASQTFLSGLLNFKIDEELQQARFKNTGCGFGTQQYDLLYKLRLEQPSRLTLVLYNSKGEIERTFFDRPNQAAGKWEIKYTLTGHNLSNRKFKAMLLVNGKEHSFYSFEFGENFRASNLTPECVNPQTY